ncbi:uncharacterized protein BJ171DRAFT_513181 [Polychytrium aggregatum]|uniref:uncharacterized protein n=1 Tax=Polychytrium aggregatum TaxID=110093 RepID=UPI0022FF1502|nr:uncharacterized protein BJ171DRAFT_513181 [Polychytrium aggregatum]KAI9202780.1 hypothetical protein BJ171DRAFT_513181 [Polychytrium aggregatum]
MDPSFFSFSESALISLKGNEYRLELKGVLPVGAEEDPEEIAPVLNVTLSDTASNRTWSGSFSDKYIEEITKKTGNFKRFSVFIEMLISSLDKANRAVSLDLLTPSDVEKLGKARSARSDDSARPSREKIYLILTYAVAFDRVHYPLPLVPSEVSYEQCHILKHQVQSLQKQLVSERTKGDQSIEDLSKLMKENDRLKHEIKQLMDRKSPANVSRSHLSDKHLDSLQSKTRTKIKAIRKCIRELYDGSAVEGSIEAHLFDLEDIFSQIMDQLFYERSQKQKRSSSVSAPIERRLGPGYGLATRESRQSSPAKRHQTRVTSSGYNIVKSRPLNADISVMPRSTGSIDRRQSPRAKSASPFRRFNPTQYIQERDKKMEERRSLSRERGRQSGSPTGSPRPVSGARLYDTSKDRSASKPPPPPSSRRSGSIEVRTRDSLATASPRLWSKSPSDDHLRKSKAAIPAARSEARKDRKSRTAPTSRYDIHGDSEDEPSAVQSFTTIDESEIDGRLANLQRYLTTVQQKYS